MNDTDEKPLAKEIPLPYGCPLCGEGKLTDPPARPSVWRWLSFKLGFLEGQLSREKTTVRYDSDRDATDGYLKCAWCQKEIEIHPMYSGSCRSMDGEAKFQSGFMLRAGQFVSVEMSDGTSGHGFLDTVYIQDCPKCHTPHSLYYRSEGLRITREKGACRHCGYTHSETDYSGDTWD